MKRQNFRALRGRGKLYLDKDQESKTVHQIGLIKSRKRYKRIVLCL